MKKVSKKYNDVKFAICKHSQEKYWDDINIYEHKIIRKKIATNINETFLYTKIHIYL